MTRADAGLLDWIPSTVAGVVGRARAGLLMKRIPRPAPAMPRRRRMRHPPSPQPRRSSGARFLAWTAGAAAVGVLAAVGGTLVRAGSQAVTAVRQAIKLPGAGRDGSADSRGRRARHPGTRAGRSRRTSRSTGSTPRSSCRRSIRPTGACASTGWSRTRSTITWDELLALPLEESVTTLACVSNEVGGDLIGNAVWLGYPIRELLARAKPTSDADMVLSRSIDGFTASTPLEVLTDDRNAILAVGMNGEPLPAEHGFPVRMVVPGLYGYVSATKWVVELEVTRFDQARAYWTDRGWSERGPIKLQSRIDVPRRGQGLKAGDIVIAGVAWQQHVGCRGRRGADRRGRVAAGDARRRRSRTTRGCSGACRGPPRAGDHVIRCRATSKTGELQTEDDALPAPDGATAGTGARSSVF